MPDVRPFDRALLASNRRRATRLGVDGADFLLRRAAGDLADRLSTILRDFPVALDVSAGASTAMADALRATGKVGHVVRGALPGWPSAAGAVDCVLDDEALPFLDEGLDLVVAPLTLQFVNDVPGALVQVRRALKPDGLFLAAMVGGDSLRELRGVLTEAEAEITSGAAPRVLPFADVRDMGGLLQRAGFALPVADIDHFTVRYDTIIDLTRDLRAMGATSILAGRSRAPLRREVLGRAGELYARRHADPDGRVRATFEIIHLLGWAPHESQPKPLRPGSAKARLADALGAVEQSAGEKAGK